jgi:hypothetical protein
MIKNEIRNKAEIFHNFLKDIIKILNAFLRTFTLLRKIDTQNRYEMLLLFL